MIYEKIEDYHRKRPINSWYFLLGWFVGVFLVLYFGGGDSGGVVFWFYYFAYVLCWGLNLQAF